MIVCTTLREAREEIESRRRAGERVGLVPTMGYLHSGHLSLVEQCRRTADFTVVSIFVNPTQFNDPADLQKYPVDLDRDHRLLQEAGVDLLYLPQVEDLYPEGSDRNRIWVDVIELDRYLCGATRPGHFRGVLTVVARLFLGLAPDLAWFGKKDWQQARIIAEMVRSLFIPVQIQLGEIVREEDGLAMSSRNVRLSPDARKAAPGIYKALLETKMFYQLGNDDATSLVAFLRKKLEIIPSARVDYAEIVDKYELYPLAGRVEAARALAVVAVFLGSVRLIDNLEFLS